MLRIRWTCASSVIVVLVLSACAERFVNEVEARSCSCVDSYCMELRDGYLMQAKSELVESDQKDAAFFARKAAAACRGELVLPQDPRQRRLYESLELDALAYRTRLMKLISNGTANRYKNSGAIIGAAQVSFDCWVQELEEGHQSDDIEMCKRSMEEKLDAIQ